MKWPTVAERIAFYGNPALPNGNPDPAWQAANLTYVVAPFQMAYNGQKLSKGMKVHKKVAGSLQRVLAEIWDKAGHDPVVIKQWGMDAYGGGYEFRPIRGAASLSNHAFGAAIDMDPSRNVMGASTGHFQTVKPVLDAFAREGVFWGGNFHHRKDWMHWEWITYS